jgi:hypothetical protein
MRTAGWQQQQQQQQQRLDSRLNSNLHPPITSRRIFFFCPVCSMPASPPVASYLSLRFHACSVVFATLYVLLLQAAVAMIMPSACM